MFRELYLLEDVASMGPCPFRHGYLRDTRIPIDSKRASMGPCPFRHGYLPDFLPADGYVAMLQWGHALSGMDMNVSEALEKR